MDAKFDLQAFVCPDVAHAPVYGWIWNTVCSRQIIDEQLAEMQRLGIRAFYIIPEPKEFRPHNMATDMAPDYLTPEYFSMCAYALKKGRSLGMNCWIYDEGGWPSGGACGQVLKAHPEYARQVLQVREHLFPAGSLYQKTSPDVLAAFACGNRLVEEGTAFAEETPVEEYSIRLDNNGGADYPDLLNKDATEYFNKITHDGYASVLGDEVAAVFTDEPKAPYMALNEELIQRYEQVYEESIVPYLPLLAGKCPVTDENIQVLYRWYDLCSQAFCENFMLPCKRWSNEHGMAFTGHMDVDHTPQGCIQGGNNFHLMRALRCLDIPGVDVIWRQIYPREKVSKLDDSNGHNGYFPRYASSAARQIGSDFALTETCGVMGPGITYEDIRYEFGYQAVRGINIFNLLNISLGRSGTYLAHELPSFTEDQIYFRDLPQMNRYLERLAYVSSLGDRVCDTALYYPIHDFWGRKNADAVAEVFDTLGRTLEDRLVDFDIVDDDVITGAAGIEEGLLKMGKAAYKQVIIPPNAYLPPKTAEVLARFVKAGGKVSYNADDAAAAVQAEGATCGLRACRRKIQGGELVCLFREGGDTDVYKICLPRENGYLLSLESGSLTRFVAVKGILEVELALGETAVLLLADEQFPADERVSFPNEIAISAAFQFQKDRELTIGEHGFVDAQHGEEPIQLSVGSWEPAVGAAYSGSGTYTVEFALPETLIGKSGMLDLGTVCYSAKVSMNGHCLGTALMPPYRVEIPAGLLREKNKLAVTVTNTSANWYVHTDYFDRWQTHQLSPYFEAERNYAKDSVNGGLYGPVKLFLE